MNGKRAKSLRRIARAYTVGAPQRTYLHRVHRDPLFNTPPRDECRLADDCTKGFLQRIKRTERRIERTPA